MPKELSKLIDDYLASKGEEIEKIVGELNQDEEVLWNSVKEGIEKRIYDEIEKEVRDKAIADAEDEINRRVGMRRIHEYKNLTIIGIVMAFFVGLLANQITDIIGMYKGTVTPQKVECTVAISFGIFFICIVIAIGLFISEIIKMLERNNDEKGNSREDI